LNLKTKKQNYIDMKRFYLLFIGLILATVLVAQVPQSINYQAVVRDASGEIIVNTQVDVKIEIVESDANTPVYTETHTITTNAFGLVNFRIGTGSTTDELSTVDWANGVYKVRTSISDDGGANFSELGVSNLSAVPYAFLADDVATKQQLSLSGNELTLSEGGSVILPDTFSGDYNDLTNQPSPAGDVTGAFSSLVVQAIQGRDVSVNAPADGQILKWDSGSSSWMPAEDELGAAGSTDGVVSSIGIIGTATKTVTLSRSNGLGDLVANFTDAVEDGDASDINEIQTLSLSGNTLSLTDGGSADLSGYLDNTDAQELTLSGTTLSLTGDATPVNLSVLQDGVGTDDQQLSFTGTTLSLEDGGSVNLSSLQDGTGTDDQALTLSGNTLSLENGGSVSLAAYLDNTDAQNLTLSGTTLSLTGDATPVDLSGLQDGTGTDDQVLSFTGTTLSLEDGGSVNLSSLQDGTGTDDQTLTLSGNTLSLENGGSVSLAAYLDNTDAQNLSLSGTTLSLTGDATPVDLSALQDGTGTDSQGFDVFTLTGTTLYASLDNDGEATKTVDLSSLQDGSGAFETSSGVTTNSPGSYQYDDFVFGAPDITYDGNAIHASRMVFDKSKSALRAGYDNAYAWSDPTKLGSYSFAGGYNSEATNSYSFAHGYIASATGISSVSIGYQTATSGQHSIALGRDVSTGASAESAIGIGRTVASNGFASVAIGYEVTASSDHSVAIGARATASGEGAFALKDYQSSSLTNSTANSFAAKFMGGYRLYTDYSGIAGVYLAASGTSWSTISDSTKKENFKPVDGELFLEKISQFNLTSWNYKGQDKTKFRHYGPMAQDFYNAFGNDGVGTVGVDTLISTADFMGVNFIAIQALEQRTRELKAAQDQLAAKTKEIDELKAKLEDIDLIRSELDELKRVFLSEAKK
jgi:phage protein U